MVWEVGAGFLFAWDRDELQAVVNALLWWWTFGSHKCWEFVD